jgi:aryl-alcohol dehydrogenase-like predicted oxidoreductase
MDYALLGRTGLRVSRLALGTAVLGLAPPEDQCGSLISAALDAGINLFDCANTYGNRASFDREGLPPAAQRRHAEELLGAAIKGHRDDVVLCTKVSEPVAEGVNDGGFVIPGVPGGHGGGLSRYHIMREVEQSLRRLDTDHIDIYHLHHPDPDTAIEETLRAVDDLITQGKVRYVGLSTFGGWQLTHAVMTADRLGLSRPVLNQVPYNLVSRGVETEVVPAASELGLSLTCFSPLAGGALAGTEALARPYSGVRRWGIPMDYTPEQKDAANQLEELARRWGHAPAHLALHWLLSRPTVAAAVIGPETPDELRQNAGVFEARLDEEQIEQVDSIGKPPFTLPF